MERVLRFLHLFLFVFLSSCGSEVRTKAKNGTAQKDTSVPSTPTNLSAVVVSATQIKLSWTASSDNIAITAYDIYRNNSSTPLASTSSTTFRDTGLSSNTSYSYTIKARDAAGNLSSVSNSVSVRTATINHLLIVAKPVTNTGTGSVSGSGINCGSTCSVSLVQNTFVTLTATPASGSSFVGWSGDCSGSATTCSLSMNAAKNVSAIFNLTPDTTAPTTPTNLGALPISTSQINLTWTASTDNAGVTGYNIYRNGSSTIHAATTTNSFSDTGLTPGTSYSYTVRARDAAGNLSAASNTASAATLNLLSYVLSVTKPTTNTGSGTVTGTNETNNSPLTLNCGSTCSQSLLQETPVTLTATPASGSSFIGWSGDCSGTATTCRLNMNAAKNVNAIFNLTPDTTAPTTPTNLGALPISTSQINLTWTASTDNAGVSGYNIYRNGSSTVLATTTTNSFSDTGLAAGTTYSYVVRARDAAGNLSAVSSSVSATTQTTNFSLIISKPATNTGTGTVSGSGINCGSTCSVSLAQNTSVTLTATSASGSNFVGWSGDCSGSATTCTLSMNAAKNVSAIFSQVLQNYTLSISRSGTGAGSVSGTGTGVNFSNCTNSCSQVLPQNTSVTLSAVPAAGSIFSGWSGDACQGITAPICTMSLNSNTAVTANFNLLPSLDRTLTIRFPDQGYGFVDITRANQAGAIGCESTGDPTFCTLTVPYGTSIKLSPSTDNNSFFSGFDGTLCSYNPNIISDIATCSFTLNSNLSIDAVFRRRDPSNPTSAFSISAPVVSVTSTTATITWTTSKDADSRIRFGLTSQLGTHSSLDPDYKMNHSITLTDLMPGTTYYFRAISRDASSYTTSSLAQTFTTSN